LKRTDIRNFRLHAGASVFADVRTTRLDCSDIRHWRRVVRLAGLLAASPARPRPICLSDLTGEGGFEPQDPPPVRPVATVTSSAPVPRLSAASNVPSCGCTPPRSDLRPPFAAAAPSRPRSGRAPQDDHSTEERPLDAHLLFTHEIAGEDRGVRERRPGLELVLCEQGDARRVDALDAVADEIRA
jgi:hypothetical protein